MTKSEIPEKVVGGVLAAIVSAPLGVFAPLGAAVAQPFTERLARLAVAEWERKSETVAAEVLEASGLSAEQLIDAFAEEPALLALAERVMLAVRITANEAKVKALGRLLGDEAGRRGDRIDETALLVEAMRDVEAPHVEVMRVTARPLPLDKHGQPRAGFNLGEVESAARLEPAFVLGALRSCASHGLIAAEQHGYIGTDEFFRITDLGRALLGVLTA